MDRANHYEVAFEGYLQAHKLGYVAVDEARRSSMGGESLKNLDFIVHGDAGVRLLIDIKGRQFPSGPPGKLRRVWESWSTRDDIAGLSRWRELFGPGFEALLVFVYHLRPEAGEMDKSAEIWCFRGRRYLLQAVSLDDYREELRTRSPRWNTVDLPVERFRRIAQPFREFVERPQPLTKECPF